MGSALNLPILQQDPVTARIENLSALGRNAPDTSDEEFIKPNKYSSVANVVGRVSNNVTQSPLKKMKV
jgi:hypothetical protein